MPNIEKATGLKSIAQGRTDMWRVDPRQLHIKANWNGRDMNDPTNQEHVLMLASSIAEVGVKEPLTVYWESGKAYVSDGHCRLWATLKAIKNGAEIKTIPVKTEDRYANEADRTFAQILRNTGKPFTSMEQAKVFKRLLDLGWQQNDIAKKAGVSASRVSQVLDLLTLPEGVKTMVVNGSVSATMAVSTVKVEGTDAEKKLKEGLEQAKAEGKTKVKPSNIPGTEAESRKQIKTVVIDVFEYSDIDDSQDEFVIVKIPVEKWEVLRRILKL